MAGTLPKGCSLCVEGKKLVLFVTGICPRRCVYCPLSEKKKDKDVIYADEWLIKGDKDLLEEAKLIDAKGAGLTGGDPLARIDRTERYISLLKRRFGKDFHIHLYTSLDIINHEKLKKLYEAGLNEIRFHPDIDSSKIWNKILLAKKFDWSVGVEIPAIPKKLEKTKKLIDFLAGKIDFLNLNELEINEDNMSWFKKEAYLTKNYLSYAVKGSEKTALTLLKYATKKGIKNVHYCSATTKDKHQMAKRIIRRAKNVKKEYDLMTKEGMLIRGAIYYSGEKRTWKKKLLNMILYLHQKEKIERTMLHFDEKNKRILTSKAIVKKYATLLKEKGFSPRIVEEYPTWDNFPIEVDYL